MTHLLVVMFVFSCSPADPNFCRMHGHKEHDNHTCAAHVDSLDRRPPEGHVFAWCEERDDVPEGTWTGTRVQGDKLLQEYFD